jgi:hypothetical protein
MTHAPDEAGEAGPSLIGPIVSLKINSRGVEMPRNGAACEHAKVSRDDLIVSGQRSPKRAEAAGTCDSKIDSNSGRFLMNRERASISEESVCPSGV